MAYTLIHTATGIVITEAKDDVWPVDQPAPDGMTVIPSIVLDAQGRQMEGARKVVSGVAVRVTDVEDRDARVAIDRARRRKQLKSDNHTKRLMEVLVDVFNTKLPANRQITLKELRDAWDAKVDATPDGEV